MVRHAKGAQDHLAHDLVLDPCPDRRAALRRVRRPQAAHAELRGRRVQHPGHLRHPAAVDPDARADPAPYPAAAARRPAGGRARLDHRVLHRLLRGLRHPDDRRNVLPGPGHAPDVAVGPAHDRPRVSTLLE